MSSDTNRDSHEDVSVQLAKALADAALARRRATLALGYVKEALRYCASTPRVGEMIREIEKELKND
jgi:hypothetical protein